MPKEIAIALWSLAAACLVAFSVAALVSTKSPTSKRDDPGLEGTGQVRPGPLRQHEGESWRDSKPGNDAKFLWAR